MATTEIERTGHVHTPEEAAHELYSVVTEVNVVHLIFTLLAVFILIFGMISALIKEKLYAGEAIVATAFGIIFGPHCANLIDPREWGNPSFNDITLEFTRIVLALSVFAVGVELPRAYVKRHWRSLIMVLGPLMIAGWLITGGLIYALVPRLSFLGALVVAACATPTDPILAASVVGKGKFAQKHVPSHIRHLLQCESGCNDGAAFPFLYLALFLIFRENRSVGHAIGMWIVLVILYQIVLGVIIGVAVGIVARKLLKFAKRRELIDRESMIAMYVSLAVFTTAVTTLAGSDDLLAAFACGAAFAWDDWFSESIEDSNFSNILDLLINCATFIYIGATMPFDDFENSMLTLKAWRLAVLGICVLLIRRLPAMLALYKFIPDIKTFREAIFAGFFGPMGVGAIFIATLALSKLPTPNLPPETADDVLALTIQPITYFLVLCSIIVHGSSVPFFNLGKRVHTVTRTWTNRSETEPSWLSRVKRAGDPLDSTTRPDEKNDEKLAEKRRHERDLEAGHEEDNQAIDDPGMDTGDFSARDYATGFGVGASRQSSGASGSGGQKISPAASSDRTVGGSGEEDKEDAQEEGREHDHLGNEDDAFDKKDKRRERHDESSSDSEEEWDEGDDVVIDHHHGEDVEVRHKGKDTEKSGKTAADADDEEAQSPQSGPGFPGQRFAEIEKMLGGGFRSDSPFEEDDAEEDGEEYRENEDRAQGSSSRNQQHDDLVHEASRRVAGRQLADETAAAKDNAKDAQPEAESSNTRTNSRPPMPKGKSKMSAQYLASVTGLARPKPQRKPSLTPEEKKARDAWCRKERKDIDDDQVKTWISGKHIVLERNNGEDVEIIDVNPTKEAREKAKRSTSVNMRELPIQDVQDAKEDVAKERASASAADSSSGNVGNVQASSSASPKRFDLKSLRQNQSIRRLFGGDDQQDSASRSAPSRPQGVPTIVEDAPEDEAEARNLPQARSSPDQGSATPSMMRQRSNAADRDESADRPGLLSTRRTGIPVERTETTDSQVRFGKLPKPSRR